MRRQSLNTLYKQYNRKYFNNELPPADVRWEACSLGLMGECFYTLEPVRINIAPALGKFQCIAKLTLLHEMAHVAVHSTYGGKHSGPHGKEFQDEMLRLAKAGALRWLW